MDVGTLIQREQGVASAEPATEVGGACSPLDTTRAAGTDASPQSRVRRMLYRIWPRLPQWCRSLALRLMLPRHSLGVCAVVQDARGRVLIARHTYRVSPWGLPGGFVRRHEQPRKALARELREELGADALVGSLLGADLHQPSGHLTLYYRATLLETPRPDGVELDGLHFVSCDEALALLGLRAAPWLTPEAERRAS